MLFSHLLIEQQNLDSEERIILGCLETERKATFSRLQRANKKYDGLNQGFFGSISRE